MLNSSRVACGLRRHDAHLIHVSVMSFPLRWRHNGCDSVSNHQPHHCLLNRLFRRRSKKTSKLRVTGLCAGNSPGTGEFSAQRASNAENVSIWWRHHDCGHIVVTLIFLSVLPLDLQGQGGWNLTQITHQKPAPIGKPDYVHRFTDLAFSVVWFGYPNSPNAQNISQKSERAA